MTPVRNRIRTVHVAEKADSANEPLDEVKTDVGNLLWDQFSAKLRGSSANESKGPVLGSAMRVLVFIGFKRRNMERFPAITLPPVRR